MPDALRPTFHLPDDPALAPAWADLLNQSPQATVFSDLAFGHAVAEAFGMQARVAAVWDGAPEDGSLAGGALVYERRRGPFTAAVLPPFVPTVTPLFPAPLRDTDLHHRRSPFDALAGVLRETYDQAALILHPSLGDVRPLLWEDWTVTPAYTYRLDLATHTADLSGWSGSARRLVQNEGDAFGIAEGEGQVDDALALVARSHARQEHKVGVSDAALDSLLRTLAAADLARVFVARRDGKAEAALVVPSDGRTAHYWIAGSAPGPAMTVLVAHVLEQLRAEGVAYFDFVGANVPSIAEFKRKFGGELVPYFRARCVAHPVLRLADRLRR